MQSRLFHILLEKQYLEKILLENRLDYLRQKYVPLIQTHMLDMKTNHPRYFDEFIGHVLRTNEVNPDKIFDWVVAIDPTPSKKYAQWILNIWLKDGFATEDAYKVTEYLTLFERMKNQLPVEQRDINKFKSYRELYNALQPFRNIVSKADMERLHKDEMHGQARVVFNDSNYKIVVPLTQEAACHFGVNTQWCTASKNSNNYFDSYNKQGDLYIILDKKNNRRWQFHFEIGQFMDENDEPISDMAGFAAKHWFIYNFFGEMEENNEVEVSLKEPITKKYRVFKTNRGYIVKTAAGLDGNIIGHFEVSKSLLTGGDWHQERSQQEDMRIVHLLNQLDIKGTDDTIVSFADIYYRDNKWGSFGEVGKPVATVEKRSKNEVWKVIENTPLLGNSNTNLGSIFRLCDGDFYIESVSDNIAYQATLTKDKVFRERFTFKGDFDRVIMPLIEARDDIMYWDSNKTVRSFYELSKESQDWILENRPTLCDPMYAYKRIGLTDDVKQSILKIFEGTSLGNISNTHMSKRSPFWIEDRLVVREWWRRDISEVLRDLDTSLYYGSFRDESTEIRDYQFKTRFKWLYYHDKDQPADTLTAYKRGYKEKADYFILIPIEEIMEMLPNFYAYIKNNTNWLTIVKMRQ